MAPPTRPPHKPTPSPLPLIRLYLPLCAYRILNALLIQTQFDPDEYWQTLEPAYCLAFSSPDATAAGVGAQYNCAYTWEWTRRLEDDGLAMDDVWLGHKLLQGALYGPVRSFLPIMPTYLLYMLAKWTGLDTPLVISRGPLLLNAALVAAPTDVAVVCIARWVTRSEGLERRECESHNCSPIGWSWWGRLGLSPVEFWALASTVTSWFNGYALVRTYSNSTEAALLAVGIALLGPELFGRPDPERDALTIRPAAAMAFVFGGMSVVIRFTAVASWVPLGVILCLRRPTMRDGAYHLFVLCAGFGLLGVIIGSLVDRYFYGFWAAPFLGSFHFNAILGKGSLYGMHHPLWYFVVGFPAICGALLPIFLLDTTSIAFPTNKSQSDSSARKALTWIIASYMTIHSFSAHKEFRFLLPILPLVCVLAGHTMGAYFIGEAEKATRRTKPKASPRGYRPALTFAVLFLLNFPHLWFLCTIHQRAPIAINKSIVAQIQQLQAKVSSSGTDLSLNRPYRIHYLMGCHSTPLYSHLHIRGVTIDAWTLDCSPQCRAEPDLLCESDEFLSDPESFVKWKYFEQHNGRRPVPDFLVMFGDHAAKIRRIISSEMGLVEISRIPHEVTGIHLGGKDKWPEVSYHNMVLFGRNSTFCEIS